MDFPEISHVKLQRELVKEFDRKSSLIVPNCYPCGWFENDVFRISKSGYWYEYEIKTSVADYRQDFRKIAVRDELPKHQQLAERSAAAPNYFSFVLPIGLIPPSEIPEYCGVYEVCRYEGNGHFFINQTRRPPLLHKKKPDTDEILRIKHNVYLRFLKGWLKENV